MTNKDIRTEIYLSGLKYWQIADCIGICAETFSRKLRHELPEDEKAKIRSVIKELSQNCGRK